MLQFYQGEAIQFPFTFTDESTTPPVLVDPAAVFFRFGPDGQNPSLATVYPYSGASSPALGIVARLSTGTYVAWVDSTSLPAGLYWAAADSTGTGQAYKPINFQILQAPV